MEMVRLKVLIDPSENRTAEFSGVDISYSKNLDLAIWETFGSFLQRYFLAGLKLEKNGEEATFGICCNLLFTVVLTRGLCVCVCVSEGEQEEQWLADAGLSNLISEDNEDVDKALLLSTLTRTQAEAVQRRLDSYTLSLRKRNKPTPRDVRDIFNSPITQVSSAFPGLLCLCCTQTDVL